MYHYNVEIFYVEESELLDFQDPLDDVAYPTESGWYYWYCFPGCLPDSDLFGPCKSEYHAICEAREFAGYFPKENYEYCPGCYR